MAALGNSGHEHNYSFGRCLRSQGGETAGDYPVCLKQRAPTFVDTSPLHFCTVRTNTCWLYNMSLDKNFKAPIIKPAVITTFCRQTYIKYGFSWIKTFIFSSGRGRIFALYSGNFLTVWSWLPHFFFFFLLFLSASFSLLGSFKKLINQNNHPVIMRVLQEFLFWTTC